MQRLTSTATWWQCCAPQAYTRSMPQLPTGRPAVDSIGIDLHRRESQLCTMTADGEFVEQRIATSRERLAAVLGARPQAQGCVSEGTTVRCTRSLVSSREGGAHFMGLNTAPCGSRAHTRSWVLPPGVSVAAIGEQPHAARITRPMACRRDCAIHQY